MFSISVTGANNEKGRQELREFDRFLSDAFVVKQKSSIEFTKYNCCKEKYSSTKRATINRVLDESDVLQAAASAGFAAPMQDTTAVQQQSTLIHQANAFQGVNLIYAVDTKKPKG